MTIETKIAKNGSKRYYVRKENGKLSQVSRESAIEIVANNGTVAERYEYAQLYLTTTKGPISLETLLKKFHMTAEEFCNAARETEPAEVNAGEYAITPAAMEIAINAEIEAANVTNENKKTRKLYKLNPVIGEDDEITFNRVDVYIKGTTLEISGYFLCNKIETAYRRFRKCMAQVAADIPQLKGWDNWFPAKKLTLVEQGTWLNENGDRIFDGYYTDEHGERIIPSCLDNLCVDINEDTFYIYGRFTNAIDVAEEVTNETDGTEDEEKFFYTTNRGNTREVKVGETGSTVCKRWYYYHEIAGLSEQTVIALTDKEIDGNDFANQLCKFIATETDGTEDDTDDEFSVDVMPADDDDTDDELINENHEAFAEAVAQIKAIKVEKIEPLAERFIKLSFAVDACFHFYLNNLKKELFDKYVYNAIDEGKEFDAELAEPENKIACVSTLNEYHAVTPLLKDCTNKTYYGYNYFGKITGAIIDRLTDKEIADELKKIVDELGLDRALLLQSDRYDFNPALFADEAAEIVADEPNEIETIEARMSEIAIERGEWYDELDAAEANEEISQSHIDYLKDGIKSLTDEYQELWDKLDELKKEKAAVIEEKESEPTFDNFSAKLAELKAGVDKTQAALIEAQEAHEQATDALKNFLDDTALTLEQKLDALPLDYTITLKKTNGSTYRVADFSEIYIVVYHIGCYVEFHFEGWKGRTIARYDTPAQVENVINMLKAAINRGDEEFTFPAVDELNRPKDSLKREVEVNRGAKFAEGKIYKELDWLTFGAGKKCFKVLKRTAHYVTIGDYSQYLKQWFEEGRYKIQTDSDGNEYINYSDGVLRGGRLCAQFLAVDENLHDSLTRAIEITRQKFHEYEREDNQAGMHYEMELYSILADAINQLKEVA